MDERRIADGKAIFAAVVADPGDPAPKLQFADWLRDSGNSTEERAADAFEWMARRGRHPYVYPNPFWEQHERIFPGDRRSDFCAEWKLLPKNTKRFDRSPHHIDPVLFGVIERLRYWTDGDTPGIALMKAAIVLGEALHVLRTLADPKTEVGDG